MIKEEVGVLRVWLLSDGAQGHLSQSQGIVDSLADELTVAVTVVPLTIRSRFWKRIGRVCLPWILNPQRWLQRVYTITTPDGECPDLIVSSGANTLLANGLLAKQYSTANVYSGRIRGYPARCYSVIFSVVPEVNATNNCVLPLPPVPASIYRASPVSKVTDQAAQTPRLAVLIGGDGAGCVYSQNDLQLLAIFLTQLCQKHQWKLLVTTSRRTGVEAETILKKYIAEDCIAQAVWWSDKPSPVISDFLLQATAVVVTEDSLTMIAESIYARKPVVTCAPHHVVTNANDQAALMRYEQAHLIQRMKLDECVHENIDIFSARAGVNSQAFPDVPAMIRAAILPFLK
jgi:uncharacterized protein